MGKASNVADFRNQANRADLIDPAQRLQRQHHRLEAPAFDRVSQRSLSRATRSSAAVTACQYSVKAVLHAREPKFNVANQR